MKKNNRALSIICAFICIVAAAAFLVYKLGQNSAQKEKWKDYDDYGWS
ncbi:MAG: hypothetical protein LBR74_10585 [Eubacterium sp.]|jgi:uncharacterized membrane protein YsdA (DUF1294 family)|nr:hypothetical protein [Eubacterium sp.]